MLNTYYILIISPAPRLPPAIIEESVGDMLLAYSPL